MKKKQKQPPLGRRQMETAGSLTPDLEGVSKSYQHANRDYTGQSTPDPGFAGHSEGIDWGRMHANRADIVPHLGRQGGEH